MQVRIDEDLCQGHALCSFRVPTIFELRDEDGHAVVADPDVPPEQQDEVRAAALNCPERAILIEE